CGIEKAVRSDSMTAEPAKQATRFAQVPRSWALLILVIYMALQAWCLAAAFVQPVPTSAAYQGGNDLKLYGAIVRRVHDGEGYYDAAATELRAQGYPSASLFNWR